MQITRTVETAAPVEKVFAYLSDFTNTTEWDPGTVSTSRISGDGGVGTQYHNVSRFLGRTTEVLYTVDAYAENSKIVLLGENATVRATDTMTFVETPHGTRVTYNAEFEFKGLVGTVAPLLKPVLVVAFKKLGDEAEEGLRTFLGRL